MRHGIDRLHVDVVKCRSHEPAAANRDRAADVHAGSGCKTVIGPETIETGYLGACPGSRLDEQHHGKQPLGDGAALVLGGEPGERTREIDGGRYVQVRDLALRACHGRANRGAHDGEPVWGRGLRRHSRPPGGALDISNGDRATRPVPLY